MVLCAGQIFRLAFDFMDPAKPSQADEAAPLVDPLVARAQELVERFRECFWFWHPEAKVGSRQEIPLVIKNLREYGDQEAWRAAQELRKCL